MNLSLKEKIHGCLAGTAIGNALGLGTEFMSKDEATRRYGAGLRDYSSIVRDAHRSQWKRGEWTNDTDFVLMLADSLVERGGVDAADFARRLTEWYKENPYDICPPLSWVLAQPDYLDNPAEVSRRTWEKMARYEASNEALGRSVTLALWPISKEEAISKAVENCRLTHYDDRCWGTAAVLAAVSHSLMWEERMPDFDELQRIAASYTVQILPYLRTAWEGELDDIRLDDSSTLWYTRKSMAAALWALWHLDSTEEILHTLVDAAGDSDTNAALGLSLAGLRYGYSALPLRYLDGLIGKERLFETADRLTAAVENARQQLR